MKKNTSYKLRFILLFVLFIAVFFLSFMLGRYKIFPDELVKIILGLETENIDAVTVVLNIRLPRVLAALLIGASLSVSGASYQGMFRNPLVSPDILGASSGAGFGASLAIILSLSYFSISLFAFLFGLLSVILAYILSKIGRGNSTLSMVLSGIMIGSLFSAMTSFIKLIADTNSVLPQITYWLMGSLSSIKKADIYFLLPITVICMLPILLLRWRINLLTTGDFDAKSMGVNVKLLKFIIIICATLLTASCVAVSGMIGFVGLVIPHFARRIFGYDYRRVLPASILLGSTFLMLTDDIARTLTTSEIPLGILTSFVGVPVFIYLIISRGERYEY
ncbi:MAG: iron ABC transporter permease [Oscillospiraceae bacterium]|nr:iron ABC transporter permease [Candidatus Ruminococcus equi]